MSRTLMTKLYPTISAPRSTVLINLLARSAACQLADQREQRQVHRYDYRADRHAEKSDQNGLDHGEQVGNGGVDLVFVKVGDLTEHCVKGAGLFADAYH